MKKKKRARYFHFFGNLDQDQFVLNRDRPNFEN